MSLLRACRARPTLNALAHTRSITTDTPFQGQVATKKPESTQIAEPVHGEVLTADVVSGAPGMYLSHLCNASDTTIARLQPNFVIAQYASTSLRATPCKVALEKRSVGVSTGISSKAPVVGKTP